MDRAAIKGTSLPSRQTLRNVHLSLGLIVSRPEVIAITTVRRDSRTPKGCVMRAWIGLRCIIKEKVVVMPHIGHGTFKALRNTQGSRPSWVCVPNPLGSGSSHRARPRIVSAPIKRSILTSLTRPRLTPRRRLGAQPQSSRLRRRHRDRSHLNERPPGS